MPLIQLSDSHLVPNMQIAGNRVSHGTKTKHSPETTDTRELVPREGMIDSDSWQNFHE